MEHLAKLLKEDASQDMCMFNIYKELIFFFSYFFFFFLFFFFFFFVINL